MVLYCIVIIPVSAKSNVTFISIVFQALEYARCILRPKVAPLPQQTKTREPEWAQEGPRGHTHLLEGFDISQLATLEALRKRQGQEIQTMAHFKVVHTI
jgi:hypothetical protein